MGSFTKSDRRQFERDVYDYAEALGLDYIAAKNQVRKARGFCGEEEYDSDNSALGDEIDNSAEILERLQTINRSKSEVLPSIEEAQTSQAEAQPKPKASPKKSPYFDAHHSNKVSKSKEKDGPNLREGTHKKDAPRKDRNNNTKESKAKRKDGPKDDQGADSKEGLSKKIKRSKKKQSMDDINLTNAPSDLLKLSHTALQSKSSANKNKDQKEHEDVAGSPAEKPQKLPTHSALDSKTEEEAHKNFLRSNQQDPHEHGQTLDKTAVENAQAAKQGAAFVDKLRDDIRFVNNKQLDQYENGQMKNARKEAKNDLEDLKRERENVEGSRKEVEKRKSKKRKSAGGELESEKAQTSDLQNHDQKARGSEAGDESIQITNRKKRRGDYNRGFRKPMIQ